MLRIGNDPNSFNDQAELANIPIDQDFAMAEDLIDAVKTIVIICIAGNVAEKFFSKKTKEINE